MNRALFLDRDGVINHDMGYVYRTDEFRFVDGIFDFCRAAQHAGYLVVVVTNQAGIAKGYYTARDFRNLTRWMKQQFRREGIEIRKVYYCPYHSEAIITRFRRDSEFRKPGAGMILRAARELNLDLGRCVLVGDKETDVEAGRRAGVGRTVLFNGESFPELFEKG